jgi:hypothetical protein
MIRSRINRLYNRLMQKNANLLFRAILHTAPIQTNPDAETIIYCALDRTSCRQYIAAIKSMLRFHDDFAVVAQSDGSLDKKCIAEIKEHIHGAIVFDSDAMFENIRNKAQPAFWKVAPVQEDYYRYTPIKIAYLKFFNVIFRFNSQKVIIIDSDLLFLKRPEFIVQWAVNQYRNDFYSEGSNARSKDFHKIGFDFTNLDVANFSSGTLGVGSIVSQEELIDILSRIRHYDQSLFHAWEIEQALWAIVMAQRENPVNIDALKDIYVGSGWRSYKELKQKAIIAHFAGAVRYNNFKYLRCFRDVLSELNQYVP